VITNFSHLGSLPPCEWSPSTAGVLSKGGGMDTILSLLPSLILVYALCSFLCGCFFFLLKTQLLAFLCFLSTSPCRITFLRPCPAICHLADLYLQWILNPPSSKSSLSLTVYSLHRRVVSLCSSAPPLTSCTLPAVL